MTLVRLVAIVLFVVSGAAYAGPKDADPATLEDLVAQVKTTYGAVQTLNADFVQVTRSKSLGEERKQRGRVKLKKPKKMRWDFAQPDPKSFVTDGRTLWIWSPADNQVFVTSDLASGSGMTQLLDDMGRLDEMFAVAWVDGKTDPKTVGSDRRDHILDLTPRAEAPFKRLRLVLQRRRYTPERIMVVDLFDNEVELTFSQVRLNQEVSDSEFTFQIPTGAQVISQDGR